LLNRHRAVTVATFHIFKPATLLLLPLQKVQSADAFIWLIVKPATLLLLPLQKSADAAAAGQPLEIASTPLLLVNLWRLFSIYNVINFVFCCQSRIIS
jgi:hypothetical protein